MKDLYSPGIAFLFPGVGSQHSGMGKSLFDTYKIFADTVEEASDILNQDLKDLLFNAQNASQFSQLTNTQLALVVTGYATFRVFMDEIGLEPSFCVGHSLGEYAALLSAGFIDFKDTLRLVKKRGEIITELSDKLEGTMVWVINLEIEKVKSICEQANQAGKEVFVSAYDSLTQSAISGTEQAIREVVKELEAEGAIIYPLKMSGPFHSPLMIKAAFLMKEELQKCTFKMGKYSVLANRNAKPYGKGEVVKNLYEQLINPIHWQPSIAYLLNADVRYCIEMGPKSVLKFLIEKNTDRLTAFSLTDAKGLNHLKTMLLVEEHDFPRIAGESLGVVVGTKNYNVGQAQYEDKVLRPYEELLTTYQNCNKGKILKKEEIRAILEKVSNILNAKKVPESLHKVKMRKLLNEKFLL